MLNIRHEVVRQGTEYKTKVIIGEGMTLRDCEPLLFTDTWAKITTVNGVMEELEYVLKEGDVITSTEIGDTLHNCIISARQRLEVFLRDRIDRFPEVTTEEKEKWTANIVQSIKDMLEETDMFYDNMPETVVEK